MHVVKSIEAFLSEKKIMSILCVSRKKKTDHSAIVKLYFGNFSREGGVVEVISNAF